MSFEKCAPLSFGQVPSKDFLRLRHSRFGRELRVRHHGFARISGASRRFLERLFSRLFQSVLRSFPCDSKGDSSARRHESEFPEGFSRIVRISRNEVSKRFPYGFKRLFEPIDTQKGLERFEGLGRIAGYGFHELRVSDDGSVHEPFEELLRSGVFGKVLVDSEVLVEGIPRLIREEFRPAFLRIGNDGAFLPFIPFVCRLSFVFLSFEREHRLCEPFGITSHSCRFPHLVERKVPHRRKTLRPRFLGFRSVFLPFEDGEWTERFGHSGYGFVKKAQRWLRWLP